MYTYGYDFTPFFGPAWLFIVALVVFIVLAVICYARYIGGAPQRKTRLGRFFNFDYFYIERILKTFYMVLAVFVTVMCVATPFGVLFSVGYYANIGAGFGGFFLSIIGCIIAFLILQFILRIGFEWMMMFIRLVVDTRAIRNSVSGDAGEEVPPINSWQDTVINYGAEAYEEVSENGPQYYGTYGSAPASAQPTPNESAASTQPYPNASKPPVATAPIPPKPEQQAPAESQPAHPASPTMRSQTAPASSGAPVQPKAPETPASQAAPSDAPSPSAPSANTPSADSWTCSQCGLDNEGGKFCRHCGHPRE